jgi:hypothetical protein
MLVTSTNTTGLIEIVTFHSGRETDTSEVRVHADILLLPVDEPTTHCSNTKTTLLKAACTTG